MQLKFKETTESFDRADLKQLAWFEEKLDTNDTITINFELKYVKQLLNVLKNDEISIDFEFDVLQVNNLIECDKFFNLDDPKITKKHLHEFINHPTHDFNYEKQNEWYSVAVDTLKQIIDEIKADNLNKLNNLRLKMANKDDVNMELKYDDATAAVALGVWFEFVFYGVHDAKGTAKSTLFKLEEDISKYVKWEIEIGKWKYDDEDKSEAQLLKLWTECGASLKLLQQYAPNAVENFNNLLNIIRNLNKRICITYAEYWCLCKIMIELCEDIVSEKDESFAPDIRLFHCVDALIKFMLKCEAVPGIDINITGNIDNTTTRFTRLFKALTMEQLCEIYDYIVDNYDKLWLEKCTLMTSRDRVEVFSNKLKNNPKSQSFLNYIDHCKHSPELLFALIRYLVEMIHYETLEKKERLQKMMWICGIHPERFGVLINGFKKFRLQIKNNLKAAQIDINSVLGNNNYIEQIFAKRWTEQEGERWIIETVMPKLGSLGRFNVGLGIAELKGFGTLWEFGKKEQPVYDELMRKVFGFCWNYFK